MNPKNECPCLLDNNPQFISCTLTEIVPPQFFSINPTDTEAVIQLADRLTRDEVRQVRRGIEKLFPPVATALIHERDLFMINSLRRMPEKRIVGVVGLAHLDGIEEHWARLSQRARELGLGDHDLRHR